MPEQKKKKKPAESQASPSPKVEPEPEKPKKKLGLQPDGSVLVDEANDFSIIMFQQMECWKRPVKTWMSDT